MKKNKNIIILALVFLFFLIIGFLIPYTGDDWNNLIGHNGKLSIMINAAIYNFKTFEGRFFSRIFVFIFNYYKLLWVVVNALCMTFFYYFLTKMISTKKSFIMLLIIEALLLIDRETFSQIYVWITGNSTYFIPFIFMIFLIYINRDIFEDDSKNELNKFLKIFLPILSFIFSMFVENVSVGIITVCLLIIVFYYLKYKKINYIMVVTTLTSMLGLIIMLNSPGTKNRIDDMTNFSNLSIVSKLLITIPRQFNYVFIKNSFLVLLWIFIIDYYIIKNFNGLKKVSFLVIMNFIPIITIIVNQCYNIFNRGIRYMILLDCKNIFVFLYWLGFLILSIYFIIKFNKKSNMKILFFFIIAFTNHAAMLISPLAGGRTSFLATIMLYICAIILIDNLQINWLNNKIFINSNIIICIMLSVFFIYRYSLCHFLDRKRESYILKQLKSGSEVVELIMLSDFYLWNPNPWDEWHMYTFKKYYNIPDSVEVKIIRYSLSEIKKL